MPTDSLPSTAEPLSMPSKPGSAHNRGKSVTLTPQWEDELQEPGKELVKQLSSRHLRSPSGSTAMAAVLKRQNSINEGKEATETASSGPAVPGTTSTTSKSTTEQKALVAFFPLPDAETMQQMQATPGSRKNIVLPAALTGSPARASLSPGAAAACASAAASVDTLSLGAPALPSLSTLSQQQQEQQEQQHQLSLDTATAAPPSPSGPQPPPSKDTEVGTASLTTSDNDDHDSSDNEGYDKFDNNNIIHDTDQLDQYFGADDIWGDVPMGPTDAILGIASNYRACTDDRKVNVCIGAYRDIEGLPWVLPSVREAERRMLLETPQEVKEYLPIEGDKEFIACAMEFAYGKDCMPMDHLAAVQTLSGTGACRVGGEFLAQFWPNHPIYVPDPTWGNHITIFKVCGLDVRKYRYYNKATNGLDLRNMMRDLLRAPNGSIILLHACAHNPTGCDPTIEEWKQIVSVISQKEHVVFFDSAYQGFASGDAEADAQPFRYAVSQHIPILLAQSFAKNFGLYGERVGTLSVVCGDQDQKDRITSVLKNIIRPMYSSPPRHGSSIVRTILSDPELTLQYRSECQTMADRIQSMRSRLVSALVEAGSTHDWSHITRQIGMFAYTGMTVEMCEHLTRDFAIYLTTNGRISVAGLNDSNVKYVAEAVHAVTKGKSITSIPTSTAATSSAVPATAAMPKQ